MRHQEYFTTYKTYITMKYHQRHAKGAEGAKEEMQRGSFSYINDKIYVFNINNNLKVCIEGASINVANINFYEPNPDPNGFILYAHHGSSRLPSRSVIEDMEDVSSLPADLL